MYRLITAICLSMSACHIGVTGGPNDNYLELERGNSWSGTQMTDAIQPLVSDSPAANTKLRHVRKKEKLTQVLSVAGFLSYVAYFLLAPHIEDPNDLMGAAGASIALNLSVLFVYPYDSDYGDIFRAYNEDNPDTPFSIPDLDIGPID